MATLDFAAGAAGAAVVVVRTGWASSRPFTQTVAASVARPASTHMLLFPFRSPLLGPFSRPPPAPAARGPIGRTGRGLAACVPFRTGRAPAVNVPSRPSPRIERWFILRPRRPVKTAFAGYVA